MVGRSHLFDDVMKMANGAAASVGALREEAEARMRDYLAHSLDGMDLVQRDEFDAVKEMAVAAREENERLSARLADLEAQLAKVGSEKQTTRTRRSATKRKTAPEDSSE